MGTKVQKSMSDINLEKSNESINKTLRDYKEKIDDQKKGELDLSNYKVTKPWGHDKAPTICKKRVPE